MKIYERAILEQFKLDKSYLSQIKDKIELSTMFETFRTIEKMGQEIEELKERAEEKD
jgi:hypothetical protein